jgi:hypothetical protein
VAVILFDRVTVFLRQAAGSTRVIVGISDVATVLLATVLLATVLLGFVLLATVLLGFVLLATVLVGFASVTLGAGSRWPRTRW